MWSIGSWWWVAASSGSPVPTSWPRRATRSPWSPPLPGRDGASWVAAGMLAPVTEAQFGEAALTSLLLAGVALWKDFATGLEHDSGLDIGFDQSGTLTVAVDASDRAALDDLLAYQHDAGVRGPPPFGHAVPGAGALADPRAARRDRRPGRPPGRQPCPPGRAGRGLPPRRRAR